MENEYNDQNEDLNNVTEEPVGEEYTSNQQVESGEQDDNGEDVEFLKAQAAKYKRIAEQREKKLNKLTEAKPNTPSSFKTELTPFDLVAVAKADLDEDGLQEVMDYARYKNISIAEALKSSVVKATLAEKAEYKKTAEATTVNAGRRGTGRLSDEALLENARKGILPETQADWDRLYLARRNNK